MKNTPKTTYSEFCGTLPDFMVREYIKKGKIKIKNLSKDWEKDIDQVTIDFHLGKRLLIPTMGRHIVIDTKVGVNSKHYVSLFLKSGESFIIRPGQFIIAETMEDMTLPANIIARLEGK